MEESKDPRIQIHANLEDVQKEIEQAAKDRKSEIDEEMKDQKKALKNEMKDLKDEAKSGYEEYKTYKKDSEDPAASEKVSTAKEASKVIKKNIEVDYEESKEQLDRDADMRKESIDRMLDDSDDAMEARQQREVRDNRMAGQTNSLIPEPDMNDSANMKMENSGKTEEGNMNMNRASAAISSPVYEVEDTLITDDHSDEFVLIHEERMYADADADSMNESKNNRNSCQPK
ncbi:MAG: hypothetical protein LUH22_10765 [Bacteroides sp.]|nr:hypothetical protein [Bacteroides sp.]